MEFSFLSLFAVTLVIIVGSNIKLITDEAEMDMFLDRYDKGLQEMYSSMMEAWWNYETNVTDHNKNVATNSSVLLSKFQKEGARNVSLYDWKNMQNSTKKRMFRMISSIGPSALEDEQKLARLNSILGDMMTIYNRGHVVMSDGRNLTMEPDLARILAESRNYTELLEVWQGWRNSTGRQLKDLYAEFVELTNEAVRANGFPDTGAYWRSWYESDTFEQDMEDLYIQLKPLYDKLHTFVRRGLKEIYGEDKFPSSGHIPAHLFGNMWSQNWGNLINDLQPYNKTSIDVTQEMRRQKYTALAMFRVADEFFTSLGLIPMPPSFWKDSVIEKPSDREVVCHASAWDFVNGKDFRIKQCTDISMQELVTVHHEMGHIQYDLLYKDQPALFRDGANPGFHEAVGDVLALSVSTPKHLQEIGLLEHVEDDYESDINYMLSIALTKIAFLPFGYLMDQWRWSVFRKETTKDDYNTKWWQLRCKYQGISPPVPRTQEDFDPGAKYHIPGNTPYIRYFVSYILQFQLHKALCQAANQKGPLHKCDIYRSKEAGSLLSNVLKLGSSKPWQEVLPLITNTSKLDAGPLVEYFTPLLNWLDAENKRSGDSEGWEETCPNLNTSGGRSTVYIRSVTVIEMFLVLSSFVCVIL